MLNEEAKNFFYENSQSTDWIFIFVILLVYPLPQLAIDIYLPSWPDMVVYFHTSNTLLQLSLTVYILFLGIAQLIYGPLSEKFGRKLMLLAGCAIFLFGSVGCLFVSSIGQLLTLRAIQGLGIGCGFTLASAILSDVFKGKMLAKMLSYSAMVYSLSIIFAPAVGGYLQYYFGWKASFVAMALYTVVLMTSIYLFLPETNKKTIYTDNSKVNPHTLSLSNVCRSYLSLFSNMNFTGNLACLILAYGIMVSFNTIAPFLLQDKLGLSEIGYGKSLFIIGFAYFLGLTINNQLLKFLSIKNTIKLGFLLMMIAGAGLIVANGFHWLTIDTLIVCVCLAFFSVGFIYPNCFADALNTCDEKGYASAFIGSAILLGVSILSVVALHFSQHNENYLAYIFLISAFFGILFRHIQSLKQYRVGKSYVR